MNNIIQRDHAVNLQPDEDEIYDVFTDDEDEMDSPVQPDYESDIDESGNFEDSDDENSMDDYVEPIDTGNMLPAPGKNFFDQKGMELKQALRERKTSIKRDNDAPLLPPPRRGSKSPILTDQPPPITRRIPNPVNQPPKQIVNQPQLPQGRPLPNPPTNPKDRALPPVPTESKITGFKAPDPPNRLTHPSRNSENISPRQSAIPPRSRHTAQPPLSKQPALPPRKITPPAKQPTIPPVYPKRGSDTPSLRSISSAGSEGFDLSEEEPLDHYVKPVLLPEEDEEMGQSEENHWSKISINRKIKSVIPDDSKVPVFGIDELKGAITGLKPGTSNHQKERGSVKPSENISPSILKPPKELKTLSFAKAPPIINTINSIPRSPLTPVSPSTSIGSDDSSEIGPPSIRAPVPPVPTSNRPTVKLPITTTGKTPKPASEKSSTIKNSKQKKAFIGPPKTNNEVKDNSDARNRPLPLTPDEPELPLALRDRAGSIDKQIEMLPVQPPESKRVKDFDWFYGNIARVEAEKHLANKKSGIFLIRKNMKDNKTEYPYILSLMFGTRVWHLQLRVRQDKQYAIGSYKSNEKAYGSVPEMIEFFKSDLLTLNGENGGQVKLLTHPRDKSLRKSGKRDSEYELT